MADILDKKLSGHADKLFAALRILTGALFAIHGAQKVLGVLGGTPPPMFSQLWVGGVIELVGGALIAVGLFTRWAAFLSSGTMAVAYVQFHWKFQFDEAFFPAINKGELAVVYCFYFLYLAAAGPGIWSLDRGERAS